MFIDFQAALRENQRAFAITLGDEEIDRLWAYYELVLMHNPLLHLVGPSSSEEFATRHVLESLTLIKHLPESAKFVDVGTGAGLPSIPCLIARDDLRATLIESKEKKTAFLNEVITTLRLKNRADFVNKQYSETDAGDAQFVTSRALDKITERLPHLIRWCGKRTMLLFGGENSRTRLRELDLKFTEELMPLSERRYLFEIRR